VTGESESDSKLGKPSDTVDTAWDWGKGVIQLIQCGTGETESDNTVNERVMARRGCVCWDAKSDWVIKSEWEYASDWDVNSDLLTFSLTV
jgi:glucan biosynthesis protein